jgi:hypothetical protein
MLYSEMRAEANQTLARIPKTTTLNCDNVNILGDDRDDDRDTGIFVMFDSPHFETRLPTSPQCPVDVPRQRQPRYTKKNDSDEGNGFDRIARTKNAL